MGGHAPTAEDMAGTAHRAMAVRVPAMVAHTPQPRVVDTLAAAVQAMPAVAADIPAVEATANRNKLLYRQ
jgi:hypothetical protein